MGSTSLVRAPETFHNGTLWPEYQALSEELNAQLEELTERVIREAIDEDVSEAAEGLAVRGFVAVSGVTFRSTWECGFWVGGWEWVRLADEELGMRGEHAIRQQIAELLRTVPLTYTCVPRGIRT